MLKKILKKNVDLVLKRPKTVIMIALLITVVTGILATNLDIELNWVALAPKGNPAVEEYEQIIEDFPTLNNIIVVIESEDRGDLLNVANEVEVEMKNLDKYVMSVSKGLDQDFSLNYGLLYSSDEEIDMMGAAFLDPNLNSFYNLLNLT
ncbi:MAG: hypothetical protein ABF289_14490, partial [Clostridiales bacterium]